MKKETETEQINPRYKIGDYTIITDPDDQEFLVKHADWEIYKPQKITEVYREPIGEGKEYIIKYKIRALWFQESKIEIVTTGTHPELFL